MKTALFIEDTPAGIKIKFAYQGSGCSDHLPESLAMNVMGNLIHQIREVQERGLLRFDTEEIPER